MRAITASSRKIQNVALLKEILLVLAGYYPDRSLLQNGKIMPLYTVRIIRMMTGAEGKAVKGELFREKYIIHIFKPQNLVE
jgi:hypothetical protein